jgi:hypothetical protein
MTASPPAPGTEALVDRLRSASLAPLRSPADPAAVDAVEALVGTRLPEDFRAFLLTAGDGGPGPGDGLLPLRAGLERLDVDPATDFPGRPGEPLVIDEDHLVLLDAAIDATDGTPAEDLHAAERSAFVDDFSRHAERGITVLADEGCGMLDVLVLRGPCAGQVWWYPSADEIGVLPLAHPVTGDPLTFTDWYALWLDRALDPDVPPLTSFGSYANTPA